MAVRWLQDVSRCRQAVAAVLLGWVCLAAGCGGGSQRPADSARRPTGEPAHPAPAAAPPAAAPPARPREVGEAASGDAAEEPEGAKALPLQAAGAGAVDEGPPDGPPETRAGRSLADLIREVPVAAATRLSDVPRVQVDEARAAAAGIRKVPGARLVLYTDVAIDQQIRALPAAFAQAFPQWCAYFGVDASAHADWHMTGFLMEDKSRFERLGLLPEELPPFEHGFSRNDDFWVYEQPSAYYRRHLVLHEGTHGFMNTVLGSCGPPWYMEGIAELLATHCWQEGRLTLNHMPRSRDEVPMWGRIKAIKDDYAAGRALRLERVLAYRPEEYHATEPYAWCWAAAAMLDRDPRYQQRFRKLPEWVRRPDFTDRFRRLMGDDWNDLVEQWQVFVAGIEYGYDVPAAAIAFAPGEPLSAGGARVKVDAARGWQSSGERLEAGKTYRLRAEGRYRVAARPQSWWCEPGGVSIRYYQGRPLGMLLAAVRADPAASGGASALTHPLAVGLSSTLTPDHPGTLYLRINDSAAELADNAGELAVEITPLPDAN